MTSERIKWRGRDMTPEEFAMELAADFSCSNENGQRHALHYLQVYHAALLPSAQAPGGDEIEAAAKALYEFDFGQKSTNIEFPPWEEQTTGHLQERYRRRVQTAVSALRGHAVDVTGRSGIYIASKCKHADRWRLLRDKIGLPIKSTWIDEAGEGETADFADLWRRNISEASSAEVLIINREKDEVLKGAWIEMGAALANGVPVYAVGIEEFTIAKANGLTHFRHMRDAVAAARQIVFPPAALTPRKPESSQEKEQP